MKPRHTGDSGLASRLRQKLRFPVMAGPMFIASTPAQVIAQCKGGILGAIPALNPRSTALLDEALVEIKASLAAHDATPGSRPAAPFAVNLVVHRSNDRLDADLDLICKHRVPLVILSLGAPKEVMDAVHGYGGLVFNDVISNRHAHKCAENGTDGLIAVAAGAGGHTGNISPFALVQEIRQWWTGMLALSGCIATGRGILAARAMGADFAYIGSPFLACAEANTSAEQKAMIVASDAADVMITDCFTGVAATFLRPSIEANGLDPKNLTRDRSQGINVKGGGSNHKAWRDIWSAGQGVGAVTESLPTELYLDRLFEDYQAAKAAFRRQLDHADH